MLIRFNKSIHLRTPAIPASTQAIGELIDDTLRMKGSELQSVIVSSDKSYILLVGKSLKKRSRVGIYYKAMTPEMKFDKSSEMFECATATKHNFERFKDLPLIAMLFGPHEWGDNDQQMLVLISCEGSAEILDLEMPHI